MSDLPSAPASAADETQSPDVDETLRVSSANRTQSDGVAEVSSASSRAVPDDAGSDARSDDDSGFRTATRLLRLLKLALGAVVSFLTALKLLGVL